MEKSFVYQKFDLRNAAGMLIGIGIFSILMLSALVLDVFDRFGQYAAAVFVVFFGILVIAFPKVIWPKMSSKMSCFYGVGRYDIEKGHLEISMGNKSYVFSDIDEIYLSDPPEGGGSMAGGVTVYDGSLEIKEGRKKLQIITWNMYNKNTDTCTVAELYEDIKENFPKLHPVLMDNGTEIRGYLKKD